MHFYIITLIYITIKEKGGNEMNKYELTEYLMMEMGEDYNVAWTDKEGNEWESDWMSLKEAAILFNEIANNPEDENQIECSLWSDIDNKDLMRYSNIENKYYSC